MTRNKKLDCILSFVMFLAVNEFEFEFKAVTDAAYFGGKTRLCSTCVVPPNSAAASSSENSMGQNRLSS